MEYIKHRLITEDETPFSVPLRNLQKLLSKGESVAGDIVRLLHAKDVEVVSHTTGALVKIYRTEAEYDDGPEECWRFFARGFEIDPHSVETNKKEAVKKNRFPGFTHRDYYIPILYVMDRHKEGKLKQIPKRTLLIVQATSHDLPGVRTYVSQPRGRLVIAGVKHGTSPDFVERLLHRKRPQDIESTAIQNQDTWEPHQEIQRMAKYLDTDSIPLFFRGGLKNAKDVVHGMTQSAGEDSLFRTILRDVLDKNGELETVEDFDRLLRRSVSQVGDLEFREVDADGKVQSRTVVTRDAYRDLADVAHQNFAQVKGSIAKTIRQYGQDSQEHKDDFGNLRYLDRWIKDMSARQIFDLDEDPIQVAISALERAGVKAIESRVVNWVRREVEEHGAKGRVYSEHLKDHHVPRDRHLSKNQIWDKVTVEMNKFLRGRLSDVLSDHASAV